MCYAKETHFFGELPGAFIENRPFAGLLVCFPILQEVNGLKQRHFPAMWPLWPLWSGVYPINPKWVNLNRSNTHIA